MVNSVNVRFGRCRRGGRGVLEVDESEVNVVVQHDFSDNAFSEWEVAVSALGGGYLGGGEG